MEAITKRTPMTKTYKIIKTENESNVRFVVTVHFLEGKKVVGERVYGFANTSTEKEREAEVERSAALFFAELDSARAEAKKTSSLKESIV